MTLLQAILLGIVQGLTEFIPISSTAHLVLASRVMYLSLTPEQLTASIAVVQLGTLLAVFIYFARDIWNITLAFIRDHLNLLKRSNGNGPRLSHDAWMGWLVIIGSIPVGVVGLLFKKQIEGAFTKNLWVIATMMVVIALLLGIAELVSRKRRRMEQLGLVDSLAVGFAQCLALIPGSSRSGSTIMAGLFVGETRETAARFSFLLATPIILAAGVYKLPDLLGSNGDHVRGQVLVGSLFAAVAAYLSVRFLVRYFTSHNLNPFGIYCILVGLISIVRFA